MIRVANPCLFGIPFALLIWSSSAASADPFAELARTARAEKETFHTSDSEAQQLREAYIAALRQLDRYLRNLDEPQRTEMREHLGWPKLIEQTRQATRDPAGLLQQSKQFYDVRTGLEAEPLLEARSALDCYVTHLLAVGGRTPAQLQREFKNRLERLAVMLESAEIDYGAIREHEVWLEALGQAPHTVAGLRRLFQRPNLVVHVSRDMLPNLAKQFQQTVKQSSWAINTILGRHVEGMTHFTGNVAGRAVLGVPNAIVDLRLSGEVSAPQNTTYAGAFRIYSSSRTAVEATKRISWNGNQFVAEPARAAAAPNTKLVGGDVQRRYLLGPTRIGNRIDGALVDFALIRARRMQNEARLEVAMKTGRRVAHQFDDSVSQRLDQLNRDVAYYYTHPLLRVGMFPDSRVVVDQDRLSLRFHVHGGSRLTADDAPRQLPDGDINVYIHESVLPNLIHRYAAGRLWEDEFFARTQKESVGDYSIELRIQEEMERWSLTLDWLKPWSTRITTDGVQFTVRASSFSIEGKDYPNPLVIRSTFVPQAEVGAGFGWRRVGEVQIAARDRLAPQVRDFLQRKLSGFFMDEFFLDGLNAPAGGAWDQLSKLALAKLDLTDGWLRMNFKQKDQIQ